MNNITCFTDEISRDFETAANVLGEKQIREFDLRNMRTGRVPYISLEEEKEVEKLLSCYDYKINTISPAVGKLNIVEPELKFKTIKHLYDSIVFAKRHGIKNIIVFSFRKKNKYDLNETMPLYGWDILEEIVELGIKYDINIMFENHSSCFISTIDSILDFKQMERFHNNVYLNWDPNNSYQVSRKKYAGEYKEICDIVKNIHVKDTIYKGDTEMRVPLGKGEVGWEQIFADLIKGEYRGKYTIETHYKPYIFNALSDIERLEGYLSQK